MSNLDTSLEKKHELSISLAKEGDDFKDQGNYEKAMLCYMKAVDIAKELATELEDPKIMRELSIFMCKQGNLLAEADDFQAGLPKYEKSLEISKEAARKLGTIGVKHNVFDALNDIAEFYKTYGCNKRRESFRLFLHNAEIYYEESIKISEEIAKELGTPESKHDVVTALHNLANVYNLLGIQKASIILAKKSLGIAEEVAEELDTPEAKRDLLLSKELVDTTLNELKIKEDIIAARKKESEK